MEADLIAAIESYAGQSLGSGTSDDGELSRQRSLSLDAYAGKMLDDPPEGRSKVNDRSVFETIQWIMPSMMRIFAGGNNVVEFDPTGPEDEEVAEQESDYLNYIVTQKNDWDLTVREWCQDALLTKNAYCLVDLEEKLTPEKERYENQSEEQVTLLLEDDLEIIGQEQFDDPNDPGVLLDPVTQQPIDPQDQASMLGAMAIYEASGQEPNVQHKQLFNIEVKRVKAKKILRFEVLPPERTRVGQDTSDFTLEDCNYFEYWDLMTISDLRKLGFDVPDDIGDEGFETTSEDTSRNEPLESDSEVDNRTSMRQVTVRTVWIRFDFDEDGIAELQRVIMVGKEILDREEVSRIPVACIVPFINTHRHMGNSITDLMFEIQRIKTKLLRSGLDGIELALNPGHAISNKVSTDDMLVSRPGRLVRLKDGAIPGEGHVMPLPTENVFPFAMQGLQHMDTMTEARVGVTRQFTGIDNVSNNDHDRIGQLTSMAAQRVEDIARLFGTGFKRLFSLAHELIIKSGHIEDTIKLRGQWVDIDPTQWRTGRDMRVTAPFAAGNKDSLVQRLMVHMQVHREALASGAPFVQMDDAYELAKMLAEATDVPATKIYSDPATIPPPPPPPPDPVMLALDVENKKVENEAIDEERSAKIEVAKIQSDAEIKELTARIQSETQIALAQIKAGQSVDLEQVKAQLRDVPINASNDIARASANAVADLSTRLTESIAEINAAIQKIDDKVDAERELIRDDAGKPIGSRRKK